MTNTTNYVAKPQNILWLLFLLTLNMVFTAASAATIQQGEITGKITSKSDGAGLPGATIIVKGTQQSAVTDMDGNFAIVVAVPNAVLEFSYMGFKTQEINLDGKTTINVALEDDSQQLDEVVVVGYGTMRKKDLTGSVASVKAKDLNSVASSSVDQMLQGRVTGMNITQRTTQPGAGISVNIRGAISPNGNNSPLYVVDGVPILNGGSAEPGLNQTGYQIETGADRNPLNTLNPNDIESIEVLKDASAAAIYGASAANGVVLITTKSGKAGKVKVEYRSSVTGQFMKKYPEVLGARDFREQANVWSREYYLLAQNMGAYGNSPVDFTGYNPIFPNVNNFTTETDWIDEVTRSGYIIDQNLSVSGGTEKTKYFLAYNYYGNDGLLKNSDFKRNTMRLNLDQEFSSKLKGGVKFSYALTGANSASFGAAGNGDNMILNALRYAPDIPVYDENGFFSKSYNQNVNNPASFLSFTDDTKTKRFFIAPYIEYKIADGLSVKGQGGYDGQGSTRELYIPVSARNVTVTTGQAQWGSNNYESGSAEGFLNYDKVFGTDHRVSAVLGGGYYKNSGYGFGLMGVGFFTDAFGAGNVGIADDKDRSQLSSFRSERTKLSQFFRVNYSLKDKYVVTFTGRRDGSSYFAENNKWAFFPSASVAWRINEEAFIKNTTAISDLKLRVGYGTAGNENILGANSLSLYQSGYNYLIGSTLQTGLALTQVANPNLKWETDYTFNVGVDYGFFNQRLTGAIEYYIRGAKDLLDYQVLPANNAVGRVAANIGETQSRGFELSVRSLNISNDSFSWNTTVDFSKFKTTWVKRNPAVALPDYVGEKDQIGTIYGWKTDGIIRTAADIPGYMPNAELGNIKYVDVNNDGVLDSKDVVKLGISSPNTTVGFGNTFTYKGLDLNFFFYGAFGYKKTMGQIPNAAVIGNAGNAPGNTYINIMTDVWNSQTGAGWMPGIAPNVYDNSNPTRTNDFYLMSGNFVRLRSITLGYTMPSTLFQNTAVTGIRFFLDAQNVAKFTKYKGFDPEFASENPYPQALSLSFGFNVNF